MAETNRPSDSLLFSLAELRRIEEKRAARAKQAERQAVLESERAAKQAEQREHQQRLKREERERQRQALAAEQDRRAREQERIAEVRRVARMEAEQELARVRAAPVSDKSSPGHRGLLVLMAFTLSAVGVTGWFAIRQVDQLKDQNKRLGAANHRWMVESATRRERLRQHRRQLRVARREALQDALRQLERHKANAALLVSRRPASTSVKGKRRASGVKRKVQIGDRRCRLSDDPLCGLLTKTGRLRRKGAE